MQRSYENKYPFDLKLFLSEVLRYEGDLEVLGADINRRFKFISPKEDMPQP